LINARGECWLRVKLCRWTLALGGIFRDRRTSGLSRKVIARGIKEIAEGKAALPGRIRRSGAGRKRIAESDPKLFWPP
jgi:hypothetical protein